MLFTEGISPTAPLLEKNHKIRFASTHAGILLFLLISGLLFTIQAYSAPIVTLNDNIEPRSLAGFVDILDNPDNSINQNNILTQQHLNTFTPINLKNTLALEHFSLSFWLKFALRNDTDHALSLWLEANSHGIEDFQLFKLNGSSLVPLVTKTQNEVHLTPLFFYKHSTATLFVKVTLKHQGDFNMALVNPYSYHIEKTNQSYLIGGMFGILVIVLLFSLLCALYYRKILFLYFAGTALASLTLQMMHIPLSWQWPASISHFDALIMICFINFTGIMQLKYYLKSWSLHNHFKLILNLALVFNIIGSTALALIFKSYSPYLWTIFTLVIPLHIMVMLYCYQSKNDTIAIALLMIKLSCVFLISGFIFFANETINLHHITETFVVSVTVIEVAVTFFLLTAHYQSRQNDEYKDALFSTVNTNPKQPDNNIINEITHSLRTPIAGIMGMAELLKNSALPHAQVELVDAISHSGQLLLNKVSEINTRLQSQNNQILQKATFELPLLIEECAYGYRLLVAEKNIEFIINIHKDIPVIVHCDLNKVRQILMQLIENAITNTAQGEVIINVQCLNAEGDEIMFSVRDTGRGIAQQELQKLRSGQDQPAMSGLSMTKLHLKALGSQLNISSKLGEGSEFSFVLHLPKVNFHDMFINNDHINNGILKNKNLLIVDDNHTYCKVIKQQATSWGMHAVETYDGNEALAMYRAKRNIGEPFNAIIIDYDMPHLSGLEVAEKILEESQKPPIMIMLTGLNLMPSEHIIKKAGIKAILNKPTSQKIVKLTLIDLFIDADKDLSEQIVEEVTPDLNILIAEDNDVSRRVISKMIELLGFPYKMVSDGQLAVDMVKKETFDVILMDCEMPVMNGFDATVEIHRWQRHQACALTPVIALTAHTMEAHKNKSKNAGMVDYLEKPIKLNELKTILARFKKVNGASEIT